MRSQHLILFICFLPSVLCAQDKCYLVNILCGIVILIMGIVIIILSTALYLLKKNQSLSVLTANSNEKLTSLTQKSKTDAISHNATSNNILKDKCNNNGSTLDVIVDIKEIGEKSESNNNFNLQENNKTSNILKPIGHLIPTIHKEEMDKVINEVKMSRRLLRSRQTNKLTNLIDIVAPKQKKLYNYHIKSNSLTELHKISNDSDEKVYGNDFTVNLTKIQNKTEGRNTKPPKKQSHHSSNIHFFKDESGGRNFKMPVENKEVKEIYRTLHKSVSCRDIRESYSIGVETLHDYDNPSRKNQKVENKRTVIMDQETGYDFFLSEQGNDFANYVNARMAHAE